MMEIKLLKVSEAKGQPIRTSTDIAPLFKEEAMVDRECFWCLHLNTKNKVIEKELISMGTLTASLVHPREVFRRAVFNGACGLILVHNHPSGDPTPSPDDLQITRQLVEAGNIIGIKIFDHVILGDGRWISFVEEGIL